MVYDVVWVNFLWYIEQRICKFHSDWTEELRHKNQLLHYEFREIVYANLKKKTENKCGERVVLTFAKKVKIDEICNS